MRQREKETQLTTGTAVHPGSVNHSTTVTIQYTVSVIHTDIGTAGNGIEIVIVTMFHVAKGLGKVSPSGPVL